MLWPGFSSSPRLGACDKDCCRSPFRAAADKAGFRVLIELKLCAILPGDLPHARIGRGEGIEPTVDAQHAVVGYQAAENGEARRHASGLLTAWADRSVECLR